MNDLERQSQSPLFCVILPKSVASKGVQLRQSGSHCLRQKCSPKN